MQRDIYIGPIIEQIVRERCSSVKEFASLINASRRTAYNIFHKKSIDIDLLLTISDALNYDFLRNIYLKD